LCKRQSRYLATWINRAAAFNGHGAGQELIKRYAGFSKQRLRSLRRFVETKLRHVHGTSIVDHIDLFEKVCGYMGDCVENPNDEKKIDWFLDTVTEPIYEAGNTHGVLLHQEGTLTFPQMVKLYTNNCFARYPQYHINSLGGVNNKKDTLSVNSNQVQYGKGKGKSNKGRPSRYENRSKGTPRSVPQGNRQTHDVPKNDSNSSRHNNKGKGKGRGISKPSKGSRNPSSQGPCSYCNRPGHNSRECRKRMKDEANKQQRPLQTQNVNEIHDDELTLLMTQNVIHMETIVDPIIAVTDSPTHEQQESEIVLGEFPLQPRSQPRQENRGNITIECNLSRLFSLPNVEPTMTNEATLPRLTDQSSSTAENEWDSSTCEPTWGNRPNTLDTDLHIWESINIPSSLSPTVYYRECEKCTSYILTSTKVLHSASTF
jgi:hypothetical protein